MKEYNLLTFQEVSISCQFNSMGPNITKTRSTRIKCQKKTLYIFGNFRPRQIIFSMFPIFFLSFCVFYRPDKNDVIKLFCLNNLKSKTGRMFILHTFINNCKIYLKSQSDYIIFVYFTDQSNFSTFGQQNPLCLLEQLQTFTTGRFYYAQSVVKTSVQKINHSGFYKLVCTLRIWFKRTLQR